MGTAAPTAPGPAPTGSGHPAPSTPRLGGYLAASLSLLPRTRWQQAGRLGKLRLPRGFGRGCRAGRSVTASPHPQQGNAPPQGYLATPCPDGTPNPNPRHHCPTLGSSSSSALPQHGGSSGCLAPACPCPQLPRAHPGLVGAGRSGCPGLPRAWQSCAPATRRVAIRSRRRGGSSQGGKSSYPPPQQGREGGPLPTAGSPCPPGEPPGLRTSLALEEDTCSRAGVGATGCCRVGGAQELPPPWGETPHGRLTPRQSLVQRRPQHTAGIPAWLRQQLHLGCAAETWLRSQHQPPWRVGGGAGVAAAPAECRGPPHPLSFCLPPPHRRAVLEGEGGRHCHPGAGGPLGPA